MCGIAGIIGLHGRPVDGRVIALLTDALAHRGPDGSGIWMSERRDVALGHRRLAILDTSELGAQPMSSADGRFLITYNGEIFNFVELRTELEAKGHRFRGHSDTEVILSAFQEWGEGMLLRFNGMWAIGIYDTVQRELFLARDRFGIKPLYYAELGDQFVFASELPAIRKAFPDLKQIDTDVASRLLVDPMRVEGSERTLFAGVRRLQGGHWARYSRGVLSVRRWWRTVDHLVTPPSKDVDQADRFRELFFDSVRVRMRSDVPIGTCLSGGFDSTAVACAMSEVAGEVGGEVAPEWREAFVASFPGWRFDERASAEEAAAFAGIKANILLIDKSNGYQHLSEVMDALGDVYIDPGINAWMIYRAVRAAGVVVTLDGHGADELMGAYLPEGGSLEYSLRSASEALASRSSAMRTLYDHARRGLHRVRGFDFLRRSPGELLSLVGDDDALPKEWGPLSRNLYTMFHGTILPTLLRNYDRLSMAHGVEVRMPFLDWRLVTYVMSLPDKSKISEGYSKKVARDAMRGRMPESIRATKLKIGFSSPTGELLHGPLAPWLRATLNSRSEAFGDLVDERRLQAMVGQNRDGGVWSLPVAQKIWPYLNLKSLFLKAGI